MGIHPTAAAGFARSAEAYERGRPSYPADAIAFLAQRLDLRAGRSVLDLAAGTGKLTRLLVPTGARVIAVEPLDEMRNVLRREVPEAEALAGTAEAIPLEDGSVDAVTVAQAFHWFDPEPALAEIGRVLRPGGALALVWNRRDISDPLQHGIHEILQPLRETAYEPEGWRAAFARRPLEEHRFRHVQEVTRAQLEERFGSVSFVAALGPERRRALLDRVLALADGLPEPIALPYETQIFLATRSDILGSR